MDSPIGLTAGPVILTVPKCLYNFGTVSKTGKIDRGMDFVVYFRPIFV